MKPILFLLLICVTLNCENDYSCEGCYQRPPPVIDTVLNDLITSVDIYIPDESVVRKVYAEVMTKKWPGHYKIIDSIFMDGRKRYIRLFDFKSYPLLIFMSDYSNGDTFFFRVQKRLRGLPTEYLELDTLVY